MNNKYKILFVEDEINIQSFVTALLEANDYQVIATESYAMAKTLYASYVPDLVILDLGLPDKDGGLLLKEIRTADLTPVIILSARGEEYDKLFGFEVSRNTADGHQRKKYIQCQVGYLLNTTCIEYFFAGQECPDTECDKCFQYCQKSLICYIHFYKYSFK